MGALTTPRPTEVTYSPSAMALIKRTVASDCNDDELNLFVHMARALRLDPLRRQIYAFVFSKSDPDKRRMSIIIAIDGFRSIAERTGNYRPDEEEPTYTFDDGAKNPDTNPSGLVKAAVRVYKYSHGEWHKVTASADWSEYAPIKQEAEDFEWVDTGEVWPDSGKPKKRKKPIGEVRSKLDTSGNWGKMPKLMLAKVAEALALRKAWPDDFSNVYAAEEMDRARAIDATPAELAEQGEVDRRMERIGGPALTVDWLVEHAPLDRVPVGQFADRAMAFLQEHAEEPSQILMWKEKNRHSLKEYWAHAKGDALELNKQIERITAGGGA